MLFIAQHKGMKESIEFYKLLTVKLTHEVRWYLLNSMVNELRFPNYFSYQFSATILILFNEIGIESVQEQIIRIIFERLLINEPYPWGLMITFRELIQNPNFGFLQQPFIQKNQQAML